MNGGGPAQSFDHRRLRHAVESAPDYPAAAAAAAAEAAKCQAAKEQADAAHRAASEAVSAIWDREAHRLFGAPDNDRLARATTGGSRRG